MKEKVLESELKLYEFEDMLKDTTFIRATKGCIVNVMKIVSIEPMIYRNLIVTFNNNEKLVKFQKEHRCN